MHRVQEGNRGKAARQFADRLADLLQALPEVLAAVSRDEHHAAVAEIGVLALPMTAPRAFLGGGPEQRIDARIARYVDPLFGHRSRRRFSRAPSVGAQCTAVTRVATRRLNSSGQGE